MLLDVLEGVIKHCLSGKLMDNTLSVLEDLCEDRYL